MPVSAAHTVACVMMLLVQATTAAERADAAWCVGSADSMTNVLRSHELQVGTSSVVAACTRPGSLCSLCVEACHRLK